MNVWRTPLFKSSRLSHSLNRENSWSAYALRRELFPVDRVENARTLGGAFSTDRCHVFVTLLLPSPSSPSSPSLTESSTSHPFFLHPLIEASSHITFCTPPVISRPLASDEIPNACAVTRTPTQNPGTGPRSALNRQLNTTRPRPLPATTCPYGCRLLVDGDKCEWTDPRAPPQIGMCGEAQRQPCYVVIEDTEDGEKQRERGEYLLTGKGPNSAGGEILPRST